MPDATELRYTGCDGWPSFRGSYIKFDPVQKLKQQRTWQWHVRTLDCYGQTGGLTLGEVKWFGRWVKYAFFPAVDCVFEATCLREIADFIEQRTTEHRDAILRRK